jgi:membrane-bound ClpP family serine protease
VPPVSPDIWFAAAVCGCLLICWEFCSPGRVFPAALGSLLALGGGWEIFERRPATAAIALLGIAVVSAIPIALGRSAKLFGLITVMLCVLGCAFLLREPNRLREWVSIPLGMVLSLVAVTLLRIASAGRARKRNSFNEPHYAAESSKGDGL